MQTIILFILLALLAAPAWAGRPAPYSGTKVIDTGQPFVAYVKKHTAGIKYPHFAVRMLKVGVPASVEVPLHLYLRKHPDGVVRLSFRLPSHVFATCRSSDLDAMENELDGIFARIVKTAAG